MSDTHGKDKWHRLRGGLPTLKASGCLCRLDGGEWFACEFRRCKCNAMERRRASASLRNIQGVALSRGIEFSQSRAPGKLGATLRGNRFSYCADGRGLHCANQKSRVA